MDSIMEWQAQLTETKRGLALLSKILDKCEKAKLRSITRNHTETLLKHLENVEKLGAGAFASKEEYQEFAIAKFYIDKCIDSFKTDSIPMEIEEGEIGTDSDAEKPKSKPNTLEIKDEIPPLEAFHLSPLERKKKLVNFWQGVKEGELYHAKVVNETDLAYVLLIVNKYLENERLIDLTIVGCIDKSTCKETLKISDVIRVSVIGYAAEPNSIYKLIVTTDKAMAKVKIEKEIKLGKIPETELPFPPIEASKFCSLTQYVSSHYPDRNPAILLRNIKALDIDPYKAYCFHPEIDGQKGIPTKGERKELTEQQLLAIKSLKQAMIWKEKKQFTKAMVCADSAIELNPKYDLAYVFRASLYERKADVESQRFLPNSIEDYSKALNSNIQNHPAVEGASLYLLRAAIQSLELKSFSESRIFLKTALQLRKNNKAEKLLVELNLCEQLHDSRQRHDLNACRDS